MEHEYIDIHSHINLDPLVKEVEDIVVRLREKHIGTITVGVDYETSREAVRLAETHPDVLWATVGMHPADNTTEVFDYEKYLELTRYPKVVAIGECGLDYFRDQSLENKARQVILFREHIRLATESSRPLMIHARPSKGTVDAYTDVLDILEDVGFTGQVNFHFFVGDIAIADRILSYNWTMSFDGPITFTTDYDEVIKHIPLINIMAETDAPFATPVPYRGQTNYPDYVSHIVAKIALIKGIEEDGVKQTLRDNARRVFGV